MMSRKTKSVNIEAIIGLSTTIALIVMLREAFQLLLTKISRKDIEEHGKEIFEQFYGELIEKNWNKV